MRAILTCHTPTPRRCIPDLCWFFAAREPGVGRRVPLHQRAVPHVLWAHPVAAVPRLAARGAVLPAAVHGGHQARQARKGGVGAMVACPLPSAATVAPSQPPPLSFPPKTQAPFPALPSTLPSRSAQSIAHSLTSKQSLMPRLACASCHDRTTGLSDAEA